MFLLTFMLDTSFSSFLLAAERAWLVLVESASSSLVSERSCSSCLLALSACSSRLRASSRAFFAPLAFLSASTSASWAADLTADSSSSLI